jgi:hemerythrin-like domain-containing protein
MQPVAVRIIREEHTAIAAVLHSLEYVVQKLEEGAVPNFQLLSAMLEYIVEYPERCHHPKENRCLFKTLRERNPSATQLIDELEAEHARGDELLKSLSQALARYRSNGRGALRAFSQAVTIYAEFHWQHMTKEEDVLLPIAKRSLTDSDWQEIAEAFLQNDNPLIGLKPKEHFAQLFDRILNLTSKPTTTESTEHLVSRDA